jgi:hypothetical protein
MVYSVWGWWSVDHFFVDKVEAPACIRCQQRHSPEIGHTDRQSKMSSDNDEGGVRGVTRAFTRWATNHESLEARQLLAGLGHLGDFLKAVSNADIDLELGVKNSGNPASDE